MDDCLTADDLSNTLAWTRRWVVCNLWD